MSSSSKRRRSSSPHDLRMGHASNHDRRDDLHQGRQQDEYDESHPHQSTSRTTLEDLSSKRWYSIETADSQQKKDRRSSRSGSSDQRNGSRRSGIEDGKKRRSRSRSTSGSDSGERGEEEDSRQPHRDASSSRSYSRSYSPWRPPSPSLSRDDNRHSKSSSTPRQNLKPRKLVVNRSQPVGRLLTPRDSNPSSQSSPRSTTDSQQDPLPRSHSPLNAPAWRYRFLLAHPELIPVLIGRKESRLREIKRRSGLVMLNFFMSEEFGDRPVAELIGSRETIEEGVKEVVRSLKFAMDHEDLAEELREACGQVDEWVKYAEEYLEDMGVTKRNVVLRFKAEVEGRSSVSQNLSSSQFQGGQLSDHQIRNKEDRERGDLQETVVSTSESCSTSTLFSPRQNLNFSSATSGSVPPASPLQSGAKGSLDDEEVELEEGEIPQSSPDSSPEQVYCMLEEGETGVEISDVEIELALDLDSEDMDSEDEQTEDEEEQDRIDDVEEEAVAEKEPMAIADVVETLASREHSLVPDSEEPEGGMVDQEEEIEEQPEETETDEPSTEVDAILSAITMLSPEVQDRILHTLSAIRGSHHLAAVPSSPSLATPRSATPAGSSAGPLLPPSVLFRSPSLIPLPLPTSTTSKGLLRSARREMETQTSPPPSESQVDRSMSTRSLGPILAPPRLSQRSVGESHIERGRPVIAMRKQRNLLNEYPLHEIVTLSLAWDGGVNPRGRPILKMKDPRSMLK